jgi:UDP-N-acetylglucosamine 2-epimerase (non-hydrolysing)
VTARILTVVGTRPEAIKMGPLARMLAEQPRFDSRVCITGQHKDLVRPVLQVFDVAVHHDLGVAAAGQDLADLTARVMLGTRTVLRAERPDMVLVHGDTTTCFAAALAAFYERIPIAHVEAGLRSHDPQSPFPEEANRLCVDAIADMHFAPTRSARANLEREGIDAASIHVTGNTGIDALRWMRAKNAGRPAEYYGYAFGPLLTPLLSSWPGPTVLVTAHRRESFGQGMRDLCRAIASTARAHRDWLFVWPVHPNPNVREIVHETLRDVANVVLADPLEYEAFTWLLEHATAIVTDSGGIQEEGPSLGKPVLVARDVTERPEAVDAGTVRLVGTDPERIRRGLEDVVPDGPTRTAMARAINPYGDGRACERIVDLLGARLSSVNHLRAGAA